MARPTLFTHPKFHRLAHNLAMPRPHVLGHLEYLWRVGYASGNPVIGDAVSVELAAEWTGEPGAFCRALLELRLLDELPDGQFAIHDLHQHAPAYVQSRARMERWRAKKTQQKRPSTKRSRVTQPLRSGYASPTPTPAPTPTPCTKIKDVSSEANPSGSPSEPAVLTYPTVGPVKTWHLTKPQVAEWRELYPTLDVLAEARKALAWVQAQPDRRKTARGMPKFLVGWLSRATDHTRAPSHPSATRTGGNMAVLERLVARGQS